MRLHTEVDVSGPETGAYHGSKGNVIAERRGFLNWGLIRPYDSAVEDARRPKARTIRL